MLMFESLDLNFGCRGRRAPVDRFWELVLFLSLKPGTESTFGKSIAQDGEERCWRGMEAVLAD